MVAGAHTDVGMHQQWREGSVLSTGQDAASIKLLTIERSQETAEYSTVMEEVFACLEYGQVDTAQALLEAEVMAGRADDGDGAGACEHLSVHAQQGWAGKHDQAHTRNRSEVPALWLEKQQESEQW